MSLSAGSRLGPYEVIAQLGVGGMSACGRSERAQRDELQRGGPRAMNRRPPEESAAPQGGASGGGAPRAIKEC